MVSSVTKMFTWVRGHALSTNRADGPCERGISIVPMVEPGIYRESAVSCSSDVRESFRRSNAWLRIVTPTSMSCSRFLSSSGRCSVVAGCMRGAELSALALWIMNLNRAPGLDQRYDVD